MGVLVGWSARYKVQGSRARDYGMSMDRTQAMAARFSMTASPNNKHCPLNTNCEVFLHFILARLPDLEMAVRGDPMQSTAIANGTHPQPPYCHPRCTPSPPSSPHATFPSQFERLLYPSVQHRPPFDFKKAQLDSTSHSTISFIDVQLWLLMHISFLHSHVAFLLATLSNIPITSAFNNSLITPPLKCCNPNSSTRLPTLLTQLPLPHSSI